MLSSWWFSALLGAGITAAGSALRGMSHKQALEADSVSGAMHATVSGMLWRASFLVTGLVLTLLLLPVHTAAFTGALMGTFVLSLIIEMTAVWQRANDSTPT